MKKIAWIIMAVVVGFYAYTSVQADDQTIYLIRHAEKVQDGSRDPALTPLGHVRAATYAKYFADKGIEVVYSSNYIRNLDTVGPFAKASGLSIKIYDPSDLSNIAKIVIDGDQTALVAGHSNTTAELANILTGGSHETLDDRHYDRVYIITMSEDGTSSVTIEHVEPLTP